MLRTLRFTVSILIPALLAYLSAPAARADSLTDALQSGRAKLFAYFGNLPEPFLPVFTPQGENPGDVYRDLFGGYLARQKDCFRSLKTSTADTHLPDFFFTKSNGADGTAKIDVSKAINAGANGGWKTSDNVKIRYTNAKVVVSSDIALIKAFLSKDSACKSIGKLMAETDYSNSALIIGEVFFASQEIELTSQTSLSGGGNVKASLNEWVEALKKLNVNAISKLVTASAAASGTGGAQQVAQITLTDPKVLPIGYRPAFISQQHLAKILELRDKGILKNIESDEIGIRNSKKVVQKYKDFIQPPKEVAIEATSGKLVPLDPQNRDHLSYMRGLGLILAIGTDAEATPSKELAAK